MLDESVGRAKTKRKTRAGKNFYVKNGGTVSS